LDIFFVVWLFWPTRLLADDRSELVLAAAHLPASADVYRGIQNMAEKRESIFGVG
jgi:hypothetical protein